MELRQLEYFVTIAEEAHFTRAAEFLGVSQSGLSAAIRTLERELGCDLFRRTTRQVELTAAGNALLPHARSLLAEAAVAHDAVVRTGGELVGELRVGAEQCLCLVDVNELLERFHRRYPGAQIRFEQAGSRALVDRLRARELDLAFIASGSALHPGTDPRHGALTTTTLGEESLVLLSAPQHPFASRGRLGWADLDGQSFIDFQASWGIRALNDEAFHTQGVARRVAFEVGDVHTLLDFVQRGLGIALVPRPIASKPQAAGLGRSTIVDPAPPRWEVSVAVGTPNAASTKFLELLSESRAVEPGEPQGAEPLSLLAAGRG